MFSSCIRINHRRILPISKSLIPHITQPKHNLRHFTSINIMSSSSGNIEKGSIPATKPGENFEPRQTHPTEDYTPDPSKSIKLSPQRQALVDDIIELYSCHPTVQRVRRYTPDCVYDDQFVYANDRYKMAGQWFALPKLFKDSSNHGYQVVKNEPGLIQFRNKQVCPPFPSLDLAFAFHSLLIVNNSHGPSKSSPRPP